MNSIKLQNIDLTGINLIQELNKRDEEYQELGEAITIYLANESNPKAKEHVLEEACDNIQVVLSVLKLLSVEVEELVEYWNTNHIKKLGNRPRKEN